VTVDDRAMLAGVWDRVLRLPVRQRAAVLLNFHDDEGRDMTSLLPLIGVTTFAKLAAALEVTVAELATIWPRLPMDDATLAKRLRLSREEVIELRNRAHHVHTPDRQDD
jgi:hypothetical protein